MNILHSKNLGESIHHREDDLLYVSRGYLELEGSLFVTNFRMIFQLYVAQV